MKTIQKQAPPNDSPNLIVRETKAASLLVAYPCDLYRLLVTNTLGSTVYVQLFDSATLPADATALADKDFNPIQLADKQTMELAFDPGLPLKFFSGLAIASSSTADTKTITAAALYIYAEIRK